MLRVRVQLIGVTESGLPKDEFTIVKCSPFEWLLLPHLLPLSSTCCPPSALLGTTRSHFCVASCDWLAVSVCRLRNLFANWCGASRTILYSYCRTEYNMFIQDTPQVQEKRERLRLVAPTSRIPDQWEMPSPPFSDTYHLAPAATRTACGAMQLMCRYERTASAAFSAPTFLLIHCTSSLSLFSTRKCALSPKLTAQLTSQLAA